MKGFVLKPRGTAELRGALHFQQRFNIIVGRSFEAPLYLQTKRLEASRRLRSLTEAAANAGYHSNRGGKESGSGGERLSQPISDAAEQTGEQADFLLLFGGEQ